MGSPILSLKSREVNRCNMSRGEHGGWDLPFHSVDTPGGLASLQSAWLVRSPPPGRKGAAHPSKMGHVPKVQWLDGYTPGGLQPTRVWVFVPSCLDGGPNLGAEGGKLTGLVGPHIDPPVCGWHITWVSKYDMDAYMETFFLEARLGTCVEG